ncbi:MAG: hypothetical protein JF616_21900 [Fibrobacteres bacterium]|nr:hypothetical protein [Fibrobacterota bacterium]
METFTGLLARHLETFREFERLQMAALESVKSQGLEGLEALLARQGEIMAAIAREKGELKPYLDQWEGLPAPERARLRAGRPGEILDSLEGVAKGIQARHQAMFGDDGSAPAAEVKAEPPRDLSQMINLYRGLQ